MTGASRVLALVGDAFGGRGGIAQYNRDLLGALAVSGAVAAIEVLPRHVTDTPTPPNGVVQRKARPGRVGYALAAIATALTYRFDIVFCGHLYMAPLAVCLARLKGARLIVQAHGVESWQRPSSLRRAAVEAADIVLSVSRYTRARVLDWAALPPERVRVVPNTVGEAFIPGDGMALRQEWGLAGRRVLLTVGRMDVRERYKGHDRVISALPALVEQGYDVVYVIVGEGDDRPRLEALAQVKGVAYRVRFMGAVDRELMIEAYRMADLFVMPSTGEGFGIAYLEAMACGTPALGLSRAGALDALGDGELGIVASDSELTESLARALSGATHDSGAVAAAVHARFGRDQFSAGVSAAVARLKTSPARRLFGAHPREA